MVAMKNKLGTITYGVQGHEVVVHEGEPVLNQERINRSIQRIHRIELNLDRELARKPQKCTKAQLDELRRELVRRKAELGLDPDVRLSKPVPDKIETTTKPRRT